MRLPFIPPADISAEQRPLYEDMKVGITAKYSNFATMREDGAIMGPWSAWLHEPELGTAIWAVTQAMTRFKHLPEIVRQVVILVVGSRFRAAYKSTPIPPSPGRQGLRRSSLRPSRQAGSRRAYPMRPRPPMTRQLHCWRAASLPHRFTKGRGGNSGSMASTS